MSWSLIADILSLTLVISGSLLILAAAIGLARFKDTMSRVHAVSKPQTTGLILTGCVHPYYWRGIFQHGRAW